MFLDKTIGTKRQEINVALIGRGFMGAAHSNAFRNASLWFDLPVRVRLKVVCATNKERIGPFAERYGWEETESDWKKAVSREDIDLVSVAAPGHLHRDIVLEAVRHKKHILCEKPLANTLLEAEEMAAAAATANIRHCCGYSYRFTPAAAFAAKLVREGRLGRIIHVHARYAQDWPASPDFPMTWRFDKALAGTGALGDIGAHSIDLTHFVTGLAFREVVGQLKTFISERPAQGETTKRNVNVDDAAQFICQFDNGATGVFEATRMATGRKNHNCIEINGDRGSVYWDFEDQNYLHWYDGSRLSVEQGFAKINATHDLHPYGGGPWPQGHGIGYADTFVIEVAEFLRAIAEGRDFHPDFHDGLKVQQVLDAVERSHLERRWIGQNLPS